ncbi:MAG: hypothetical protein R3F11_22290 [Verrucomicrobiales bacterium]
MDRVLGRADHAACGLVQHHVAGDARLQHRQAGVFDAVERIEEPRAVALDLAIDPRLPGGEPLADRAATEGCFRRR